MLKQRVITGAVLAVLVVGSILYGELFWSQWVATLLALVMFFAARELVELTLKSGLFVDCAAALVFALLFWWVQSRLSPLAQYGQALAGLGAWLVIAACLPFYRRSGSWPPGARVLLLGLGLCLLWICAQGLLFLYSRADRGEWLLLYLLSLVWVADIGAYFSGRRFGKNKLAPTISPGKTREGVIGAVLANLVWANLVFQLGPDWGLPRATFVGISLGAVVLSIAGDLFVSILKRESGVKDSGSLLPGHGGVLDRIDSLTAATPVFVGGLYLAGSI